MNRYDTVNAFAAYAALHETDTKLCKRLERLPLRDLVDVHKPYSYDNRPTCRAGVLDNLSSEALAGYFGLVDRYLGREEFEKLVDEWRKINSVDGVTIYVCNDDGDPTHVNFEIRDSCAYEWSEKHGALDGGTWESVDGGKDYVYDRTYWHEKLFEEIKTEGYDLDFSNYGEPDENELRIASAAAECDECQGDYSEHERHEEEGLDEMAVRKIQQESRATP